MVSLKRSHFLCIIVFLSHCCANIGRELRLMLSNTYKEYMTPIHAFIFEKHVKMCVYKRHIKKPVSIDHDYTLGEYMQQKNLAGRSFFQNTGSQGLGHVSPGRSSRAVPLSHFFMLF